MLSYVSGVSKRKWVDARREDILDAPYFHVVLQFRKNSIPLSTATRNSYTLLFIMRLQILSVNLLLIVNILGLISAIFVSSIHGEAPWIFILISMRLFLVEGWMWKSLERQRERFFLPIKVISKTFRGKYMAELKQLWENDRLEFHGSAAPYKTTILSRNC